MSNDSSSPRPAVRWLIVGGVTAGFVLLLAGLTSLADVVVPGHSGWSPRGRVLFDISTIAVAEGLAVLGIWGLVRRRDHSFRDLGLWRRASLWGWALALLLAAATVGVNLFGALRSQLSVIAEMSGFYLYSATLQVLGSGVTFGLAHAGLVLQVASMEGGGWIIAVSNLVMFTVLGAAYAGIYLASRRSLMPVIVSHLLNDFFVIPLAFLAGLQASS